MTRTWNDIDVPFQLNQYVMTTQEFTSDWNNEARSNRAWGVLGYVIGTSQGNGDLRYHVKHFFVGETKYVPYSGWYHPKELICMKDLWRIHVKS